MQRDLKELEKAFERGLQEWQKRIVVKYANRIGLKLVRNAKKLSPTKTGNLKRRWFKTVTVSSNEALIKLCNDADYAAFVNNGHRIVCNGRTVGYRAGHHMAEEAIESYQTNEAKKDIEDMLQEFKEALR